MVEARHGIRQSVAVLAVLVGALALVSVAGPVADATASQSARANEPAPCRVVNQRTEKSSTGKGRNLQETIRAAPPGDTLRVKGRCVGNFIIKTSLKLIGKGAPQATLDGGDLGRVLTVKRGVGVFLTDLTVTGGHVDGKHGYGGGIYATEAPVTLNGSSSVTGNTAQLGGGINTDFGPVTLNGSSSVTGNTAFKGGGIFSKSGSVTMNASSSVTGNSAWGIGGGICNLGGTLTGVVDGGNVKNNNLDNVYSMV